MPELTTGRFHITATFPSGQRWVYEFVYEQLANDRWEYALDVVDNIDMYSCSYAFRGDEQSLRRHILDTVAQWRYLEDVWYMDRPLRVRRGKSGPVVQFTYRREERGRWLYSITTVGKQSLSRFDVDSYTFRGSERALRKELRNTVNGWRYSHDAAKWLLDGLAVTRNDGRLIEFQYSRVIRGYYEFYLVNVDNSPMRTPYHIFNGSERSLRSFLRKTANDWRYSEAQEKWYIGGRLVVKRTDGRTFRYAYSPLDAALTSTVRSDAAYLSGFLYSTASPTPGSDQVVWSYGIEAVDGESADELSDQYVCSQLDRKRFMICANSDMPEFEGSEHCLRRYLKESIDEWQYDETLDCWML